VNEPPIEPPHAWEGRHCSDHGCVWGHPGGMGTNGGCQHLKGELVPSRRIIRQLGKALREERVEVDRFQARVDADEVSIAELEAESKRLRSDARDVLEWLQGMGIDSEVERKACRMLEAMAEGRPVDDEEES
jgi:hypothetical protein